MSLITRLLSLTLAAVLSTSALAVERDWGQVAQALGKSGSEMPGGVYRIGLPRTDLKVVLDGVELKPALALGSWLAFRSEGGQALVMGDLVLEPGHAETGRGRDRDHGAAQPPVARRAGHVVYARSRPRRSTLSWPDLDGAECRSRSFVPTSKLEGPCD